MAGLSVVEDHGNGMYCVRKLFLAFASALFTNAQVRQRLSVHVILSIQVGADEQQVNKTRALFGIEAGK